MENEIQNKINAELWNICENLKTNFSIYNYNDYVLTMLFIKFISDMYKDKEEQLLKKYNRR